MSTKTAFAAAITLSACMGGCKPTEKNHSRPASLDNMVNGADGVRERTNRCGLQVKTLAELPRTIQELAAADFVQGQAGPKLAALGVLAAVPQGLLLPLTLAQGHVVIADSTAQAAQLCVAASLGPETGALSKGRKITSCWLQNPARIVLPPDDRLIRHSLLRQIAYFYTESFVDRVDVTKPPFNTADWQREVAAFRDVRTNLSASFMSDIAPKSKTAIATLSKLRPEQLANFIYAEALDSYYCSTSDAASTPRGRFKARFPKAYAVFTDESNAEAPARLFGRR